MTNLKELKNNILVENLKNLVGEERKILNEILEYLQEVNQRKIYLNMAYGSLFEFCVKELGYSASAAYRRIESSKLLSSFSQTDQSVLKSKIQDGKLNLTHLSQAQSFFKAEKKNNKTYSAQEKTKILNSLESKSKLETEKILVQISPQSAPSKPETFRPLNSVNMELKTVISSELLTKISKLKNLKSHINPKMTTAELFELLVDQELKRMEIKTSRISIKPAILQRKTKPLAEVRSTEMANVNVLLRSKDVKEQIEKEELMLQMGFLRTRYIPINIKREIWQRDKGRCCFTDKTTGKICESKHLLQIDHIQEFSMGGLSTNPANLRLLCFAHHKNRHQNEKTI